MTSKLPEDVLFLIAKTCYEANAAWQSIAFKKEFPVWIKAPVPEREVVLFLILYVYECRVKDHKITAKDVYEKRIKAENENAWAHKNKKEILEYKNCPPWHELTNRQKLQDRLLFNIVQTFIL